jgi:hypothetical protein
VCVRRGVVHALTRTALQVASAFDDCQHTTIANLEARMLTLDKALTRDLYDDGDDDASTDLVFSHTADFDENGVLFFLGTQVGVVSL